MLFLYEYIDAKVCRSWPHLTKNSIQNFCVDKKQWIVLLETENKTLRNTPSLCTFADDLLSNE